MKRFSLPLLLTLSLILAACAPSQTAPLQTDPQPASVSTEASSSSSESATRSDQQGAVTVTVTPVNLGNSADQLEFDISLETHSVDLSMDLATLATLTTDTGLTVSASQWDAPRGGHHVTGKLIFPSAQDGKAILEGATKVTLTILNVDAQSRVFEWTLK